MKEDYLWDKTGSNAEIENLENALAAFRYKETAAPRLPARILPFKKEKKRRFLPFAIAACAALAAISSGVWLQISGNKTPADSAGIIAQREDIVTPKNSIVQTPDYPTISKDETRNQFPKQKIFKIKKVVPAVARQNRTVFNNSKPAKPETIRLTKEEKYAYNQLMLALSITGSKLKMVKDKVEGSEE